MLSMIMISLSVITPSYSNEVVNPYKEPLVLCDKALSACDEALQQKDQEVQKQAELLAEQAKQLVEAKEKSPLNEPVLWVSISGATVALAGPVAIPFVVIGAVLIGLLVK